MYDRLFWKYFIRGVLYCKHIGLLYIMHTIMFRYMFHRHWNDTKNRKRSIHRRWMQIDGREDYTVIPRRPHDLCLGPGVFILSRKRSFSRQRCIKLLMITLLCYKWGSNRNGTVSIPEQFNPVRKNVVLDPTLWSLDALRHSRLSSVNNMLRAHRKIHAHISRVNAKERGIEGERKNNTRNSKRVPKPLTDIIWRHVAVIIIIILL